ncbi:hypothetical protein FHT86_000321 [Rhizobium sp. BK313]|jgi:hypothetical protein|uniref:hypothetical protein n=1 Tax=Rhizobium sp. BK313 TaxID=2587081 RepID=UPI001061035E|nr:hypothetical protein [Rhizobium sp. BK313]MBB3452065.1 hypothetical protein [Rhizobium sp. BK313]
MSVLRTVMATGLIALTLGGAAVATTTSASASERGAFWGGLAAGAVGGALAAEAVRPAYPAYYYGPAYEPVYWRPHHHCTWGWHRDRWGHPHRVEVCR